MSVRAVVRSSVFMVSSTLLVVTAPGCSALQGLRALVQPPHFEQDEQQPSEIRLNGTSGASVRIWARVSNPNSFGVTLGMLRGTLQLEGSRAATVEFPFGLPLAARGDAVVPIDVSVSFRDLAGLGQAMTRALSRQSVEYELEGMIGVNAAGFGEQMLGPMTILRGKLR